MSYYGSPGTATEYDMEGVLWRARAGDVIQLKEIDGDYYHSIFVTGINKDGKMAYCGHTESRKERALEEITGVEAFRFLTF